MSDISTDMEAIIKELQEKYPEQCKLFQKGQHMVMSNDIDPMCGIVATGKALIYWFRDVREKWYASNRKIAELEEQLANEVPPRQLQKQDDPIWFESIVSFKLIETG